VLGAPSPAAAHESVKAIIVMEPGVPRAGETVAVDVSVLAPPGLPLLDQIQGVRIVGQMTGHNMTPVEANLSPTAERGGYRGACVLTMSGPWEMTIHIKVANEEMWGVFPVDAVRADQAGDPIGMRYIVEMRDPIRANILSPWLVVGLTLALVALIEASAVAFKIWRERQPVAVALGRG
jgi:hypothetical protein